MQFQNIYTICPRCSDPFYIVKLLYKMVTTSQTYSTFQKEVSLLVVNSPVRYLLDKISLFKYIFFLNLKKDIKFFCSFFLPHGGCFHQIYVKIKANDGSGNKEQGISIWFSERVLILYCHWCIDICKAFDVIKCRKCLGKLPKNLFYQWPCH